MKILRIAVACLLVMMTQVVFAHHSNTPYDMNRSLHVTGVVKQANFKNPHSSLTLEIADAKGTRLASFEGHSLATLRHYGLTPSMVKIGDTITISYAPRRDTDDGGIFLSVTTASGQLHDFTHLGYEDNAEAK